MIRNYLFRCTKCNNLTFVDDFDVAFSKGCVLKIINANKKEHELTVISDNDDDVNDNDDEVVFNGKFLIHPCDRLKRFVKQ